MDRAVVLVGARGVERVAERLPLIEESAVLHAVLERDAVWHVVLLHQIGARSHTLLFLIRVRAWLHSYCADIWVTSSVKAFAYCSAAFAQ